MGHADDEVAAVTEKQKRVLLPLFRHQLRGDEKRVLDLGCGPGRFTRDLAALTGGLAVGLDPTRRLLELAPSSGCVAYVRSRGTEIPVRAGAFSAVWICQVLGGIVSDRDLVATVAEIRRALERGGLLFLVENTSDRPDGDYWRFRSLDFYRELFRPALLDHLADYDDLGERNSVLSGRIDE
jgi:SAM-dependent methyltransferase